MPECSKTVSTLAAQIKGLIAVQEQEGDTPTNFGDEFRAKWKAIDTALDTVFGDADADDANDTVYDHIEALPGNAGDALSATAREDMVETLDKIVAALTNADDFAAAVADDGVFEGSGGAGNAAAVAKRAGETFAAVDSTATAYIAMTENTRFGISKKQTRTVANAALSGAADGDHHVRLQPDEGREVRGSAASRRRGVQRPDNGHQHGRQDHLQR